MDAAKVLPKCFPVLEIVRTWATAIRPNPGVLELHKGMNCMHVTVGRFFVGEMPPTTLCQAIIILRGGAPFCPFGILMVGAQVQEDVLPLNKISAMPSIPLRYWDLSWEQPGHGDQVPISYLYWGIMAHMLKVEGWGMNFIELSLWATPRVAHCLHFRCWLQSTGHKAVSQQLQEVQQVWGDPTRWWCWSPHEGPGTLGSCSPSGGSRLLWWTGGFSSDDGSIWIRNSCHPEEGSLLSNSQLTGTDSHQDLNFVFLCWH